VAIHILEDDPGVSDSLLLFLQGMGHDAVVYPDAESFFEAEPPKPEDTIIVDLNLPGISGAQVIVWLRTLKSPPRVVAITGQPQSVLEKLQRTLHGVTVLRKPLSSRTLADIV
jgi:FixJ family two-component response regulator